jgi:RNA polymerase sigma-32 factor
MKRSRVSGKACATERTAHDHIRRIGQVPPMSPEEEVARTREYARTRDPRLAQQIAAANLRLVIKMAGGYARRSTISFEDLIQEGTVGLMHAIEKFDPRRGVRFASYATWWIRAYLLKALLDSTRIVRAGRSRADRRGFFHGEAPPAELSLDAPMGEDGAILLDALADEVTPRPDQAVEEAQAADHVRRRAHAFHKLLPPREAAVFEERFLGAEAPTLTELADQFELSRERIRQIEQELVSDFRDFAQAA